MLDKITIMGFLAVDMLDASIDSLGRSGCAGGIFGITGCNSVSMSPVRSVSRTALSELSQRPQIRRDGVPLIEFADSC